MKQYFIDNELVLFLSKKSIKKKQKLVVKYRMKSYICNRLKGLRSLSLESCLSGRKDLFAKQAYGELYQGFESLTLRFLSFDLMFCIFVERHFSKKVLNI